MDFYAEKSKLLPRLIYRNLMKHFELSGGGEQATLEFIESYLNQTNSPDYLKFVWNIPEYLKKECDSISLETLEKFVSTNKQKRPIKLRKSVYPHVADEFTLDKSFLDEVFDSDALPKISNSDIIFTMGSCFARNFSRYMNDKGVNCANFGQAEDLNSPGSNYIMLQYCQFIDDITKRNEISELINLMWADENPETILKLTQYHFDQLAKLNLDILKATKVIITLGNTIDYYTKKDDMSGEHLIPKFLAMVADEDVRVRNSISARLKKNNTYLRLSTTLEVTAYIEGIYKSIRAINPSCSILITVSPVPIDSVLGIDGTKLKAVEIDCVSKSTIRVALHEAMHTIPELSSDSNLYYLPSFEIVRWIAPMIGIPVFGQEDAASRHVSNHVLNAVCDFAYRKSG
jgi:hypothetical protein